MGSVKWAAWGLGVAMAASASHGATIRIWDGLLDDTTPSSDWFNSQNWVDSLPPDGTTYNTGVKFVEPAPTVTKIVSLSANTAVNSLNFSNSVGWLINNASGSRTLKVGYGYVSSTGSGTNTIAVKFQLDDGGQMFNIGVGNTLVLTGGLDPAAHTIQKVGAGTLSIQSNIDGNMYTLTTRLQANAGVVELGGSNGAGLRYAQATGTGTIKLIANNQFGTGASTYYVATDSSGLIDLNGYSSTAKQLYVGSLATAGVGGTGGGTVNVRTGNLSVSTATMLGGTITGETGGTLTLSGDLTTQASASTSTISSNLVLAGTSGSINVADGAADADLAITGNITTTNANVITKTGAGTLSFGGIVSVPVTVSAGTIGGNGTLAALAVSGTVAPGNSIGTLHVGSTTFNTGSSFDVELGAGVSDLLAVTGDLTLGTGVTLNLLGAADNVTTYIIATYTGTLSGDFGSPVLPSGYTIEYHYDDGVSTNNIALVIPEPASIALLAGGLGLIGFRGRRCRA